MKQKVHRKIHRFCSAALAAAMLLTCIPATNVYAAKVPETVEELTQEVTAEPAVGEKQDRAATLVNIAADSEITVSSSEAGKGSENLVDGDDTTLWVQNGGTWPSQVSFKLPEDNTRKIKKVVLKFEKGHTPWSVNVELLHALNSVTSDLQRDNLTQDHPYDDMYEFTYDSAISCSHIFINLSNPKNDGQPGLYWPALAEVEIWAEEEESETALTNVAGTAEVTSVGGDAGEKAKLTDEDYGSLYVFNNGGISTIPGGVAWVEMNLDREYPVKSMEAAFELSDPDANDFHFTFDVLGKSAADTEWQPLFTGVQATRLANENIKTLNLDTVKKLKSVRIHITKITSADGDPWPALAEFKIFADTSGGTAEEDTESIAYNKPIHTNTNQSTVSYINDGSTTNKWTGARYPAYIDIDLEENYNLSEIQVFTPSNGYSQYSIYTSMDGRDFDKLAEKTSKDSCPAEGEIYQANNKEARIVRLYVEYQSTNEKSYVNEVRVLGEKSGTAVQETPEVRVQNFQDSSYNKIVTENDTIEEVKGIVSRRLEGINADDWFVFTLKEPAANGYDYFDLTQGSDGKIHITGNDGVSLATGLNHYLKYYCNVNISQVGDQAKMPADIVPVEGTVHKETKFPVRYSYNYCTLSYSMAFWGEEEWRNELDWLALNGVNVVLDATAQEEVWRRFLGKLGYTHQEAKDFIAGPAYYAWAYMANLTGFGGPVHDSWFEERTELARKNQLIMRKLGMQPVLQGYSGMVPVDIKDKDPSAEVIKQGTWCSFQRPYMLKTDGVSFARYAQLFYQAQREVYGDISDYYATDPFHEGGNTGGMDPATISGIVLDDMLKADPNAVWIIQSWQGNPTTALLQGLEGNRDHAMVLDLYAEKTPHWNEENPNYYGGAPGGGEFLNTPWVYCMLNNFGGRLGLHGHIENFVNGIAEASKTADHMVGIGITPEASVNNPVLYDLFFETIWTEDGNNLQKINLDQWFKDYTTRRYGAESESAYQAMLILNETVYNPALNMKGQGAPESVVNARPKLDIGAASTWGNAVIDYDKEELERAAALLLKDYDLLKDSAGYQYDLANVLEQVLSNTAQEYQKKMAAAFRSGDAAAFKEMTEQFMGIVSKVEEVTGTQEEFMVGTWIESAKALAKNADDFTKELYELNARSLITTWGSYEQAISGGLIDYSNRQWAGLTEDYYKARWELWIAECEKELAGQEFKTYDAPDWFEMEWEWARANDSYPTTANGMDLQALGTEVLEKYTIPKNPAANDEFDLPAEDMTSTAGSAQAADTDNAEGPAKNVLDDNNGTIWHSSWNGAPREDLWIDIQLSESQLVNGLRMLPRSGGGNGVITKYRIEVSNDNGATYTEVASGTWANDDSWKMAAFEAVNATNVRLYAVESYSNQTGKNFASAAEIRIMAPAPEVPVDKEALNTAITAAEALKEADYTAESWKAVAEALKAAKAVAANEEATQEEVDAAKAALQSAVNSLKKPDPKPEEKPDPKPEEKPDPKPEEKPDPKPEEKPDTDGGSTSGQTTTPVNDSPKTGDDSPVAEALTVLFLSAAALLIIRRKRNMK